MRAGAALGVLALLAGAFAAELEVKPGETQGGPAQQQATPTATGVDASATTTDENNNNAGKPHAVQFKYVLHVDDPMLPWHSSSVASSSLSVGSSATAAAPQLDQNPQLATSPAPGQGNGEGSVSPSSGETGSPGMGSVRKRQSPLDNVITRPVAPPTPSAPGSFEFTFQGTGITIEGKPGTAAATWKIDGGDAQAGTEPVLITQGDLIFGDHTVSYPGTLQELAKVEVEGEVTAVDFNSFEEMRCENFKFRVDNSTLILGDKAADGTKFEAQKLEPGHGDVEVDVPERAALIMVNGSTTADSGTYEASVKTENQRLGALVGSAERTEGNENRLFYLRSLDPAVKYKFHLALKDAKPVSLESMRVCYATKADKKPSYAAAIGGGVVGGVVGLSVIGVGVYLFIRRQNQKERRDASRAAYYRSDSLPSLADSPHLAEKGMLDTTAMVSDKAGSDGDSGALSRGDMTRNWVAGGHISGSTTASAGSQSGYSAQRTSLLGPINTAAHARPDSSLLGLGLQPASLGAPPLSPNDGAYSGAARLSTWESPEDRSSGSTFPPVQYHKSMDATTRRTSLPDGAVPSMPSSPPHSVHSMGSRNAYLDPRVPMPGFVPRRPSAGSYASSESSDGDTDETSPVRVNPKRPPSAGKTRRGAARGKTRN